MQTSPIKVPEEHTQQTDKLEHSEQFGIHKKQPGSALGG